MGERLTLQRLQRDTSVAWAAARKRIGRIERDALVISGCRSIAEFATAQSTQTAVVLFLAGAGSRWVSSVREAQARGEALDINPDHPRCLAPVTDVTAPERQVGAGLYNLRALAGLGETHIIWRTHLAEIAGLVAQAGIAEPRFVQQTVPAGLTSPLGHGDALRQLLPQLSPTIKFVMTVFGGDVTNRQTLIRSLLVMSALQKLTAASRPQGLLPTTFLKNPTYTVLLDGNGLPVDFGHNKLSSAYSRIGVGQSNVGVRIYLREGLGEVLDYFSGFYDPAQGYRIPGNKSEEFALDNIDAYLAAQRRLRTLCVALPEEITPYKEFGELENFLAAQRVVLGVKS